ncbi:unnamed protein product, partial [Brassica rapa subsp. trilocularis]
MMVWFLLFMSRLAKQSITSQSQVDSLLLLLTGDVHRDRACCMYPSDHQMRRVS